MKIAFIGQKGIPAVAGGVEKHVEDVAIRMAEMGHEVFVYVRNNYTDRNLKEYKGVKLIHLPSISTKNLDAISHTFLATMHAVLQKYDVVHYQAIGPSSLSWIIKFMKPKTALVSTFHCQDYYHQKWGVFARVYLKFGEWMSCKAPDKTIVVSGILKEYVKNKYGRDTVYISNGADVAYNPKTQALNQWNLKEKRYIVSIGRLIKHKGLQYLIEAFKKIEDTNKLPNNFKLVIVGDGFHTDDYVKYLKKISRGRKNIIFTGNQNGSALEQLFSHAYAFVQPSESEGRSIALIEALGYGLATIVSDIKENLDTVLGRGYTFKNKNVEDLVEKLAYILNKPEEVKKAGEEAKLFAQKEYGWETKIRETLAVYEELISVKKGVEKTYVWKSKKA